MVGKGMARVGNRPLPGPALGTQGPARVARVARVYRARTGVCIYGRTLRPDKNISHVREDTTLATLATLANRWGTRAESGKGLEKTLDIPLTGK